MAAQEIDLTTTGILPEGEIVAFQGHWLTSIQQIVALGATPEGIIQIITLSGLEPELVSELLERTRECLSPVELRQFGTTVATQDYGLGAIPPNRER